MASFFDRMRIPTAQKRYSQLDLSCDHITTMDFFQLQPVYRRRLQPGQSITVDTTCFSRLATMIKPTFGDVNIKIRAFWVPYRHIWNEWNQFITDTAYSTHIPKCNYTTVGELADLVRYYSSFVAADTEPSVYDFSWYENRSTSQTRDMHTIYYKHTTKSKLLLKILNSLGYKFPLSQCPLDYPSMYNRKVNVFPILCFVKIYSDWYSNSSYQTNIQAVLDTARVRQNYKFTRTDIDDLLKWCLYTHYDNDYFVSAWDNPSGANSGLTGSDIDVADPTFVGNDSPKRGHVISDADNTSSAGTSYVPTVSSASSVGFTLTLDHLLHAVTSYVKRHQLAGSRAIDRFFARFGKQLTSDEATRCRYLGNLTVPVQIADVYATSDTLQEDAEGNVSGAALGDYSAKGVAYTQRNGHFSVNAGNDFGEFIICATIVPRSQYYQGIDRELCDLDHLDFYTPEFDGVGVQPILRNEIAYNVDTWKAFTQSWSAQTGEELVFGYLPRYAHLKVAHDNLTGDFVVRSLKENLRSFHMFREIKDPSDPTGNQPYLVHNYDFTIGKPAQYDRIFNVADQFYEHFYSVFHFKVVSQAPMKPLFDTLDFELDDEGKPVSLTVGGTRLT